MHHNITTSLRRLGDQSWHDRAACRDLPLAESDRLFFPISQDVSSIMEARQICGSCPVQRTCLDAALESGSTEGIWGGMTDVERAPLHKGLPQRQDYARVTAVLAGEDVHISSAERKAIVRIAVQRGMTAEDVAYLLKLDDEEYATRLMATARRELAARNQRWEAQHDATEAQAADTQDREDYREAA